MDGGGHAAQAGPAARGGVDAAPEALARGDAAGRPADGRQLLHLGLPAALDPRAPTHRGRRGAGGPSDPRLVRTPGTGGRGGAGVPARHVHPVHRALLGRAVPLAGALPGPPGRRAVLPQDEATGAGAHTASARFTRSSDPHAQRGRFRGVRRSAVPLAAVRRPRAFPARGGPGGVLHRADQLAEGPRARPVTTR
ncbi:hypothetical protein SGPA1_60148 [Streptomyces misionensis JCM 4497]